MAPSLPQIHLLHIGDLDSSRDRMRGTGRVRPVVGVRLTGMHDSGHKIFLANEMVRIQAVLGVRERLADIIALIPSNVGPGWQGHARLAYSLAIGMMEGDLMEAENLLVDASAQMRLAYTDLADWP